MAAEATGAAPTVALLYDSPNSVEHLRAALAMLGADLVYEAPTGALDRDALALSRAEVVVVNLDGRSDPDLDDVYALLDDARYRVIFNDADASAGLSGWDQARWARHLAAKISGAADIDPPRPENAEPVPPPLAVAANGAAAAGDVTFVAGDVPPAVETEAPSWDATAPHSFADELQADPSTPHTAIDAAGGDDFLFEFEGIDPPAVAAPVPPAQAEAAPHVAVAGEGADFLSMADFDALLDAAHGATPVVPPDASLDAALAEGSGDDESAQSAQGGSTPATARTSPSEADDVDDLSALLSRFDAMQLATDEEGSDSAADRRGGEPATAATAAAPFEPGRTALGATGAGDAELLFAEFTFEPAPDETAPDAPVDELPAPHADDAGDGALTFSLSLDDGEQTPAPADASVVAAAAAIPVAIAVPSQWALEDMIDDPDALPPAPPPPTGRADFGIEKMSAQDFLAPAPEGTADFEEIVELDAPLQRMSLEEAVAPVAFESAEAGSSAAAAPPARIRVDRVWVLGASIGGPESVREFLAEFPRGYPGLFLLAQHLGPEFVDMMVKQLAKATPLTVRTPTHGERVGHGEVVVVPSTHRLQVDAEGVVVLERTTAPAAYTPSIDQVLRDAADRFGANAGAIIFSGMSQDAVDGSRHLAALGGRIYAQHPDTCVVSSMVDGVCEAGLVSFLGSPRALALRVLDEAA